MDAQLADLSFAEACPFAAKHRTTEGAIMGGSHFGAALDDAGLADDTGVGFDISDADTGALDLSPNTYG